jgi:hypothetical protein
VTMSAQPIETSKQVTISSKAAPSRVHLFIDSFLRIFPRAGPGRGSRVVVANTGGCSELKELMAPEIGEQQQNEVEDGQNRCQQSRSFDFHG